MTSNHIQSQYDYLLKFLVVGNAGVGKSCLLHQYVHSEFKTEGQHTIGAELGSKIVVLNKTQPTAPPAAPPPVQESDSPFKKLANEFNIANPLQRLQSLAKPNDSGDAQNDQPRTTSSTPPPLSANQTRVKLQIWDTAGQERFRSVTRSYYRGACGALLVYDITDRDSFNSVSSWLSDARTLASQNIVIILCGNKSDLEEERQVTTAEAESFANENHMYFVETSAKSGENVAEAFLNCTQQVIDKVETGVIDPNAPGCGILVYQGASRTAAKAAAQSPQGGDGEFSRRVDLLKQEADEAIGRIKNSNCC